MIEQSIANPAPSVKTPPARPYLVTCGGRRYWLSVIRACGHDDLIPDEPGGHDFASRDDIPCAACRSQTSRPSVPSLIGQPYGSHRGGAGAGRATRRPTEHRGRRPRRPSRQRQIMDALHDFNAALDFLAEVQLHQRHATDEAIAHAQRVGDQALRRLRQLGAAV